MILFGSLAMAFDLIFWVPGVVLSGPYRGGGFHGGGYYGSDGYYDQGCVDQGDYQRYQVPLGYEGTPAGDTIDYGGRLYQA